MSGVRIPPGVPAGRSRPSLTEAYPFGSTNCSQEELVAEMAAAFLHGHAGIANHTADDSAAYLANWQGRLAEELRLLIQAASVAQKAAEYLLSDNSLAANGPQTT